MNQKKLNKQLVQAIITVNNGAVSEKTTNRFQLLQAGSVFFNF